MIEKKVAEIHGLKQDAEKLFQEYKKTGTREFLTTFIEMYNRDLVPAIHHLRTLKYAHMYVETDESEPPVSYLRQHLVSAHSRDYTYGEDPKVMKFVTNV
jgi:predicted GTPase